MTLQKVSIRKYVLLSTVCILLICYSCKKNDETTCIEEPEVAFSVEETFVSTGSPLQFTDESTNVPDNWLWDFGDGSTSTEQNPQHIYNEIGTYTVTLISGNDCGDGLIYIRTKLITAVSNQNLGKVSDYDGKSYYTVKIGDQWWMAENLATTKFNNGNEIPLVTDMLAWSELTTPAYCYHYNDADNHGVINGALYNWYAIETGNLCPDGWHVPSESEWQTLETTLGMSTYALDDEGFRGGDEGMELKATLADWNFLEHHGSNTVGFTALPGGARNFYYSDPRFIGFFGLGLQAYFWSSTENSTTEAWYRMLDKSEEKVWRSDYKKEYGLSIRCVKD